MKASEKLRKLVSLLVEADSALAECEPLKEAWMADGNHLVMAKWEAAGARADRAITEAIRIAKADGRTAVSQLRGAAR